MAEKDLDVTARRPRRTMAMIVARTERQADIKEMLDNAEATNRLLL